jgi:hypothetical protein
MRRRSPDPSGGARRRSARAGDARGTGPTGPGRARDDPERGAWRHGGLAPRASDRAGRSQRETLAALHRARVRPVRLRRRCPGRPRRAQARPRPRHDPRCDRGRARAPARHAADTGDERGGDPSPGRGEPARPAGPYASARLHADRGGGGPRAGHGARLRRGAAADSAGLPRGGPDRRVAGGRHV